MGATKAAVGDTVLTFLWISCASMLGLATSFIANAVGVQDLPWPPLFITTALVFVLVFVFTFLGDALGGASFNPTGTASFYAAGLGADTLFSMALRFPAQALGAVGGVLAINEVMPQQYKHMLGGPSLKVDVHTGAIAEGVLTFVISFLVLVIILKGPRSPVLKMLLLSVVTVTLVVAGSVYTGPSMNPANAFGWAYLNNWHNTWEQFYVYWICPFIGAILAGWIFRAVFPPLPAKGKKKKAKKA
ncbi:aquaporin SIP1-2 [Prunus yedoensis var. nudiflora]|uniref:Aquaporin SIP1-2 n=1 Tax=Prunus yedoensis var. nudiflora TaxID=2094558 RepID=A0A314V1H4_PRUYE|nr:aquaporin SIP1-2 [Prunus yedoensis var. nudiflora]